MFALLKRSLSGGDDSSPKKSKLEKQNEVSEDKIEALTDEKIDNLLPKAPEWGKNLFKYLHDDLVNFSNRMAAVTVENENTKKTLDKLSKKTA